jgi:hypothetical protein
VVKNSGGTPEAFYYAYGRNGFFTIVDLPDGVPTTAVALTVSVTGGEHR